MEVNEGKYWQEEVAGSNPALTTIHFLILFWAGKIRRLLSHNFFQLTRATRESLKGKGCSDPVRSLSMYANCMYQVRFKGCSCAWHGMVYIGSLGILRAFGQAMKSRT